MPAGVRLLGTGYRSDREHRYILKNYIAATLRRRKFSPRILVPHVKTRQGARPRVPAGTQRRSGMLQNPDLLLLDEPQNHLDVRRLPGQLSLQKTNRHLDFNFNQVRIVLGST